MRRDVILKSLLSYKVIQKYLATFLLFLLFLGCKKDKTQPENKPTTCDSLSVGFQLDIMSIMTSNCSFSGCHSSGSGVGDFTSYSGVKAKVDNGQFQERALYLKDMPPTYSNGPKSLNNEDLQKLQCWIDDGAQNN